MRGKFVSSRPSARKSAVKFVGRGGFISTRSRSRSRSSSRLRSVAGSPDFVSEAAACTGAGSDPPRSSIGGAETGGAAFLGGSTTPHAATATTNTKAHAAPGTGIALKLAARRKERDLIVGLPKSSRQNAHTVPKDFIREVLVQKE